MVSSTSTSTSFWGRCTIGGLVLAVLMTLSAELADALADGGVRVRESDDVRDQPERGGRRGEDRRGARNRAEVG